jgi:hypothetical protein
VKQVNGVVQVSRIMCLKHIINLLCYKCLTNRLMKAPANNAGSDSLSTLAR